MKKRIIITIIIVGLLSILLLLSTNKTFFKNTYIGVNKQEIFIPKYSFFKDECCMTAATFYSLKSKKSLQKEIDNYLKDFKYFSNKNTYGYKKNKLFIQSYEIEDKGLYRKIIIVY